MIFVAVREKWFPQFGQLPGLVRFFPGQTWKVYLLKKKKIHENEEFSVYSDPQSPRPPTLTPLRVICRQIYFSEVTTNLPLNNKPGTDKGSFSI